MIDAEALRKAVEEVVASRFAGIEIVSIEVKVDEDVDGDDVLQLKITLDVDDLEAHKLSGFLRYLQPKLKEIGESKFPVASFLTKSDASKLKPEAA